MRFLLTISCVLLATVIGGGCAHKPVVTVFDAKWEFIERPGQAPKACLGQDDVMKLRELLIRCKAVE